MILSYFVNHTWMNKITYSLPLIFAASILPDTDFIFSPFFPHQTITHSLTLWVLLYTPLLIIKKWKILPYFAATLSHFLIGDVITGNPPLLYGLSDQTFGLAKPWLSDSSVPEYGILFRAIVEAIMVLIFTIVIIHRRDMQSFFSHSYDVRHILVLGIVVFVVFLGGFSSDIVYVLSAHREILYLAYGIVAISEIVFLLTLLKGTSKTQISEKIGQKLE
jgi:hypothetical protein